MTSKKSAAKRKHVTLTISEKVEIIKKLDKGASVKNLCEVYGVGLSTIYDIRKQREKLFKFCAESDTVEGISERRTLHSAKSADHDNVLYEWFRQRRSEGLPVSGAMLMEKAKQFHTELRISSACEYSQGWLQKFKHRHGIRLKATGEQTVANRKAVECYITDFAKLMKNERLTPEQVYNADETDVFWRCLPRRTLACAEETVMRDCKESKERLTVLTCANAAGTHKCKLLVVGRSAKPCAFKGMKIMPVLYEANKCSWVTQEIMKNWFHNHFVPEARAHCQKVGLAMDCKIVLLLDNCSAHPPVEQLDADNVFPTYLPPSCTPLIQPMDQGVTRSMKSHYRNSFLRRVVNSYSTGGVDAFKKVFSIKDAIWCLANAWDSVTRRTLQNAWHKLCPVIMFNDEDAMENIEGFNENKAKAADLLRYAKRMQSDIGIDLDEQDIVTWLNCEDDASFVQQVTDSEIIEVVLQPKSEDTDNSDEEDNVPDQIKMEEGINLASRFIHFLEQQSFISQQDVMHVHRIREKLIKEQPKHITRMRLQQMFDEVGKSCALTPSTSPSPIPSTSRLDETKDPELAAFAVNHQPLLSMPLLTIGKIKQCME
ncbi:tigger transposable element-derived protein 2-like [Carcharodon carcharias]|uniref:tigger transposable element-derived protein 2-like n=1 Tax=Carcharodon carcharias TaxID=13397 RepID=UPI001B7ED571|nr:tigger transposable element-derived protein 2-like [Carcharodon carcharias]